MSHSEVRIEKLASWKAGETHSCPIVYMSIRGWTKKVGLDVEWMPYTCLRSAICAKQA